METTIGLVETLLPATIEPPMKRTAIYYFVILITVGAAIMGILHLGASLPLPGSASAAQTTAAPAVAAEGSLLQSALTTLGKNGAEPLSHLFLQLLVIIGFSRIAGKIFVWAGQPAVVGEMAAGILLGPSLFGLIAPGPFAFIFTPSSLGTLKLMSQVGVCLFMFSVGMELDLKHVRTKAHTAVMVSHSSIVFPYLLGVILAYFLYSSLAHEGASFLAFALFMGISMSITAFPVLARIIQE
ncbi:MAG: cation/H(+) antiporter, partial [Verrucomicrobiaceae bacterium]|nr:cation/H(+) antiporter [Verrucomicrobiaceae bacterium]